MKTKDTILQISPFYSPNVGGVETHLTDLMHGVSRNYKQLVVTYQPLVGKKGGKKHEHFPNLEIIRVPHLTNLFYKTVNLPLIHFLYLTPNLFYHCFSILRKRHHEISAIHAHGINAAVIASVLGKIFSIDYFVSFHVEFNFVSGNITSWIYKSAVINAKKIFVLTRRSVDELVKLGLPESKIQMYSYWVDQKLFSPISKSKARKLLKIRDDVNTVLFVGRLSRQKGVDKLISLAKNMTGVHFYIAGVGEMEGEVKSTATNNKNIFYLGRVENKDLPLYYSASNLTIVPSEVKKPTPTFVEGVPRVIIESISCGTPVVGTDSGGMKEVILNGRIGNVIEDNKESIKNTLDKLFDNKKVLDDMSKKCRDYAVRKFSPKNVDIFIKTYKQQTLKMRLFKLLRNTGDFALKRRSAWLLDKLNIIESEKVLDAGCGDGFFLHLISEISPDTKLFGFDFDKNAIKSAKCNLRGKKIDFRQGDLMDKLPYDSNYFDKIIMSEVAEHLPDDLKGLKEVYRVLKAGGTLALSVPSKRYPFMWDPINWLLERLFAYHIKSGFFAGIWNQHERLYKKKQIVSVGEKAGFDIIESEYQTWWCLPFNHYLINFGARILAGEIAPIGVAKGGSKFNYEEKRGSLANFYYYFASIVDNINNLVPIKTKGVSIVLKMSKPFKA